VSNLSPENTIEATRTVQVKALNYTLWPFQERVLERISGDTLILGLPTGLGKTFVAGAFLKSESFKEPIRVLFMVPSIPLGVQQTLFVRRMMNVEDAYFVSGETPPMKRALLKVWNPSVVISTPQTFSNDFLTPFMPFLEEARRVNEPISYLSKVFNDASFRFPFTHVIADECQRYVGETDGYAILLTAKACEKHVLALSATPQLHAPERLKQLKVVFDRVEIISIEEPEIKKHMPKRVLRVVRVPTPEKLLRIYSILGTVINTYTERVKKEFGAEHLRQDCDEHITCIWLKALRIMRVRCVEDGASSILKYGVWKLRELHQPLKELGWKSLYKTYQENLREEFNHKVKAALRILEERMFEKAIVFMESVQAAKQLGGQLQQRHGLDDVAVLVGKGAMSMEQQASALLQFKERARVLSATSVAEEGLDIPSADIEVWLDPPSNPRKWIQRFGRILRQPGGKEQAVTYVLISMRTHEKNKLLSVMKRTEEVYGFTQDVVFEPYVKALPKDQRTLGEYQI